MKSHVWDKFIIKLKTAACMGNEVQIVYDDWDASIRIDVSNSGGHEHIPLSRKQLIKLEKLIGMALLGVERK